MMLGRTFAVVPAGLLAGATLGFTETTSNLANGTTDWE